MKLWPQRNNISDYIKNRNERLYCFLFLSGFCLAITHLQPQKSYSIADYDLANHQDRELHELLSMPITEEDIARGQKIRKDFLEKTAAKYNK